VTRRTKQLPNLVPPLDQLMESGLKTVTGGVVHKADDLFYQCTRCQGIIPSLPDTEVACSCGNVSIEFGPYFRMGVFYDGTLRILRWTPSAGK